MAEDFDDDEYLDDEGLDGEDWPEDEPEELSVQQQDVDWQNLRNNYQRGKNAYNSLKEANGAKAKAGTQAGAKAAGGKATSSAGSKATGGAKAKAGTQAGAKAAGGKAAASAGSKAATGTAARAAGAAAGPVGIAASVVAPVVIDKAGGIAEQAKSKLKYIISCACCCCGSCCLFLLLGPLLFVGGIVGALTGEGNNACPVKDMPQWSRNKMADVCYLASLKTAEEQTQVPWEIIAAIDYRQYKHGENDPRDIAEEDALVEIGRNIQLANRARDKKTGELLLDATGNPQETITPDINDKEKNVMGAMAIMSNYYCVFIKNKGDLAQAEEECFKKDLNSECERDEVTAAKTDCGGDLEYWRGDKWLTDYFQETDGVPDFLRGLTYLPVAGKVFSWIWDAITTPFRWFWDEVQDAFTDSNDDVGAVTWYNIWMGVPNDPDDPNDCDFVAGVPGTDVYNPDNPNLPPTPGGNGAEKILNKACEYVRSVRAAGCVDRATCSAERLYNGDRYKQFSDCYGFDVTVVRKSGVDPNARVDGMAHTQIREYYSKHPEKYLIIHPVTSTKQLLPGDLLFNVDYGSHASIYTGGNFCGCTGSALSASLNDHGPQCSLWYSKMSWAVRVIN